MIGKLCGTIERQTVIDQRRHVFRSSRRDHHTHPTQPLAIDLPQQIEFVPAPPRLAR